jgi:hypothetical protein
MGGWFLSRRDSPIVAWHEVPGRGALGVIYAPKVAKGLSLGFQTHLSFIHNLSVGSPPRPIFLTPAFTHPLQSSFPPESIAQRCERNTGWGAYATLTPLRRHYRYTAIAPGMALGDRSTVRKANGA